jgi:outer membrane biosynthesis protein TonB
MFIKSKTVDLASSTITEKATVAPVIAPKVVELPKPAPVIAPKVVELPKPAPVVAPKPVPVVVPKPVPKPIEVFDEADYQACLLEAEKLAYEELLAESLEFML